MAAELCYGTICFFPLDASAQKFFGFSEFLASLALMVIAWTTADVRYQFRITTAPIPLQGVTFTVIAGIGMLTLLTDLWRAEQWLVPRGSLLSPASWQGFLGAVFLLTFLTWAWFAFIQPPIYGRHNARRFARALYRVVLKGSPGDLAVIADELTYSVKSLVANACGRAMLSIYRAQREGSPQRPVVETYANDLLLLIADKRLCRAIVESSPATALTLFQEVGNTKKYDIQISALARNIMNEAITNRESFLFHEAPGCHSGLLGYQQPMSQAMFSNYPMVEGIGTMLDHDYRNSSKWDAVQWEAYCRVALITFKSYVDGGVVGHSFVLYRVMKTIENIPSDVQKLNGVPNVAWDNDTLMRLDIVVDFIRDAINILDEKGVPDQTERRVRDGDGPVNETMFDILAGVIFKVVSHASAVTSPSWECWSVQHNAVWGKLFNLYSSGKPACRIVQFKARRLLFNEIRGMNEFPNFRGARILGLCLNVMGLKVRVGSRIDRESRALQKAVLSWTKKYFVWLYAYNPRVAEVCLVGEITYDAVSCRLVKTSPVEGLRREPHYAYLDLAPASAVPPVVVQ